MKETGRPSTLPEESVHENLNFAISLTAKSLNFNFLGNWACAQDLACLARLYPIFVRSEARQTHGRLTGVHMTSISRIAYSVKFIGFHWLSL